MSERDETLKTRLEQCSTALQSSEARFRNIITRSADGILIVDSSGVIRFANPAAESLFDRKENELLGQAFGFPVLAGETSELTIVTRKDKEAIIEMRVLETEWGEEQAFVANLRDITEQKRTMEALRKSEERYSALVHASSQALYSMSPDWSKMQKLQGGRFIPDTEQPNPNWLQMYIPPDDQKRVLEVIDRAVRAGTIFEFEHRVRRVDGTTGWTLSRAVPVRNADGEIVEWFGAATDITDRKQAEEELRASEERLQKAISTETVGVLFFNLDGRILAANSAFERMSTYTNEELVGIKHWKILTAPEFWPATIETAERLATYGKTPPYEKQMIRKDGSRWWGLFAPTRLYGSGSSSDCIEFIIDITERKNSEENLKKAMEQATRSNRELEQFAYVASHDLQEPLRMVSSYMQLLQKKYHGKLDEKAHTYINYAVDGAQRMQALITGLLKYSRLTEIEFGWVDTSEVFADAVANLNSIIQETGAEITNTELPVAWGDRTQLMQLFQNLLSNAIKYRNPGIPPRIIVRAEQTGRDWLFSVKDNGIGIEQQNFEMVFEIFRRLHTKEEVAGTGIGLASCKKIVEQHHGRIWVESTPGEGSTFFFTVPIVQPEKG